MKLGRDLSVDFIDAHNISMSTRLCTTGGNDTFLIEEQRCFLEKRKHKIKIGVVGGGAGATKTIIAPANNETV